MRFDGHRRSSSAVAAVHLALVCRPDILQRRPRPARSRFGESGGRGAGLTGTGRVLVLPAVHAATPGVHEEVADGGELQTQLLRDGDLHLFAGSLVLLEDGDERSALQVGEDQTLLLGDHVSVFVLFLFLSLAGCHEETKREREVKIQEVLE